MPIWLATIIAALLGSSMLGVILNHVFQQRREREKGARATRAERVARQRAMCDALLDAVIRQSMGLHILESIHDNRGTPFAIMKSAELALREIAAASDSARVARRELDLKPNAQLQEAIERYGDAAIAYQKALVRPMSSVWNIPRFYWGKTPAAELSRLVQDLNARTAELKAAVRDYRAHLE